MCGPLHVGAGRFRERSARHVHHIGRAGRGRFQARINPDRGGRHVAASADDAGELLRGLDYLRSMQGGRISVQADYDDAQPDRPLAGTAEIEDFRIRDAPIFGKLLQAMTLYGLLQVVQGPGLGFTRLVAPFRLTDQALELTDARAFSPYSMPASQMLTSHKHERQRGGSDGRDLAAHGTGR